jgi:hypothetical protein
MRMSTVIDTQTGKSVNSRLDFTFSDPKILYHVSSMLNTTINYVYNLFFYLVYGQAPELLS